MFGQQQPGQFGMFGQQQQQPPQQQQQQPGSFSFGQTGAFGTATTSAGGFSFGSTNSSGSTFQLPQSSLANPASTGSSLFGPSFGGGATSTFGTTTAGGGMFGTQKTQPAATGSMFGQNSSFGSQGSFQMTPATTASAFGIPPMTSQPDASNTSGFGSLGTFGSSGTGQGGIFGSSGSATLGQPLGFGTTQQAAPPSFASTVAATSALSFPFQNQPATTATAPAFGVSSLPMGTTPGGNESGLPMGASSFNFSQTTPQVSAPAYRMTTPAATPATSAMTFGSPFPSLTSSAASTTTFGTQQRPTSFAMPTSQPAATSTAMPTSTFPFSIAPVSSAALATAPASTFLLNPASSTVAPRTTAAPFMSVVQPERSSATVTVSAIATATVPPLLPATVTQATAAVSKPTLSFGTTTPAGGFFSAPPSTVIASSAPTTSAPTFLSTPLTSTVTTTAAVSSSLFQATTAATSSAASLAPTIPAATTITSAATIAPTLTFSQLELAVNKWKLELEEQERTFYNQATQVNAWDRQLISNADKITRLHEAIERAKVDQQTLEHECDYITEQQRELEDLLKPLEESIEASPGLSLQQHADIEREHTYHMAENIDGQLKRMSEDLKDIIKNLNECNSEQDTNNPITQISRILNAHMDSLQWIDQNTGSLQRKVEDLSKLYQLNQKENEKYRSPFF